MLKLLFQFTLLLSVLSSYSQVRNAQAVIFFANNDSLSVEIKEEQLKAIQKRIQYRLPGSNNYVTGLPEQIKSVKFADGRWIETVKTDSVSFLLPRLIEGFYNLYAKLEKNGLKTYYIRHEQDTLIHLFETLTDQYIKVNGELRRLSNFEYVHQLTYAMADNAKITSEIPEIKFREDELVSIVKEYNEFKGNKYSKTATINQKKTKVSTGIFINGYPFVNFLNETEFGTGLGMSFDFYRNRPYERVGLKTSISFNILDYYKVDNYRLMMEIPLALTFKVLDHTRVKLNIFGGLTSFTIIDSYTSYDTHQTDTYVTPCLYFGTGIDYKIKKSALRFEVSLFTKSFLFGYIF